MYSSPPRYFRSLYRDQMSPGAFGIGIEDDSLSTRLPLQMNSDSEPLPFTNGDVSKSPDRPGSRQSSRISFPENRQAVMQALQNLQDKIRKLESERTTAEDNLRSLSAETSRFRNVMSQPSPRPSKGVPQHSSSLASQTAELEQNLSSAENRCQLLEKQLDYMRKMVQNSEQEKQEVLQRYTMKDRIKSASMQQERQAQLDKIAELEREQIKLAENKKLAEMKIKDLEVKVREEKLQRRSIEDKLQEKKLSDSTDKVPTRLSPREKNIKEKKKGVKKVKKRSEKDNEKPVTPREEPQQHYHIRYSNLPFIQGKSTGKSHHVGANVQNVLSLMKSHNPILCTNPEVHRKSSSSSSTASSESDLSDLLLQLQEEFAQLSFEHDELTKQINEATSTQLEEDLGRELDVIVHRMELKGDQISRLKRHKTGHKEKKLKKAKSKSKSKDRPKSTGIYNGFHENGEVQVTTTIKTRGKGAGTIRVSPSSGYETNLKLLRDMKKLQTTLRKDDIRWDY